MSFRDPAPLYGILCLAAVEMAGKPIYLPSKDLIDLRYRVETITAVQKNLADPQKATSDVNIASVFSLLCLEENLQGRPPCT
jgi:hypothetical protein